MRPDFALDGKCPLTIADSIARAAAIAPDVEAIVAADGRLTFADVSQKVGLIASALARHGIGKGDHVGLCLGNRTDFYLLFLALGTVGATSVPINTRFKADELRFALAQSRVSTLFVADSFLGIDFIAMLRDICPSIDSALPDPSLPSLARVVVLGGARPTGAMRYEEFLAGAKPSQFPPGDAEAILLIQYTSGTTASPKGVMLRQGSMLANAYFSGARTGFRIGDRFHSARPFFHVAGTTLSILATLQHMVTLVTMDRFQSGPALDLMEREACTHFSGNDTMALMLLDDPSLPGRKLSLRGGWAAASPGTLQRIVDELGASEIVCGYGLSEASPNVAQSAWWEEEAIRLSARMMPQPGVCVRIVDQDRRICAAGQKGEIQVRGWNVMQGYHDAPEHTAQAIDKDGWLSTGDLGALDANGRLTFHGRIKEIVRVGGENVSPAEVEAILHGHPAIRQAAVIGVPDPRLMEVIAAFVVAASEADLDAAGLTAWCKRRMAGFKVPRHIWFVSDAEALGMTASSKVRKAPLVEKALAMLSDAA